MAQDSKMAITSKVAASVNTTNIAWVDAGLFRHESSSAGFDTCPIRYQRVRGALLAVSDYGPYPSALRTIYLAGPRREVAAGVMVFNRTWYRDVLYNKYRKARLRLHNQSMTTTEQGILTLLAQRVPEIHQQTPNYERIAARLLCGV